jgi:hypothetical protein
MKLQSLALHLALLFGSWSVVNSKSNSGINQSNNGTKGVIRHQQTFETRLNHLVVDNIAGRVSFTTSFMMFYERVKSAVKCQRG